MFDCFLDGIKNYVNFSGSASRPQFWYFQLASVIIGIIVGIISVAVDFNILPNILSLFLFLPSLTIGVRRLRDADFSPWLLLIVFIPFIGIVTLIVLWCMPSESPRPAQI